jgi:hypothetical protein
MAAAAYLGGPVTGKFKSYPSCRSSPGLMDSFGIAYTGDAE